MNSLDWTIIVVYLGSMIGLSSYLGRGQQDDADYYLGGRDLPWWAVGLSTMATQTSAISFISIPAFVALKQGGGFAWLQYELALPLAILFTMLVLLPFFRRLELVTVYEYLERRFGPEARLLISGLFLASRGLGTGVGLYASAIVLSVCLGVPVWATILLMGVVTVVYDVLGGMKAVVYSDVVQMVVLLGGLVLCIGFVAAQVGGIGSMFAAFEPARYRAFDPHTGLGDGAQTPFWALLFGGFFLYTSYYGADQSQVQRELSAPTVEDTNRSLLLNGFARFPLTLLYMLLGVAAGAAYAHSPELQQSVDAAGKPDFLVPHLILQQMPQGLRALLFAAILSAAMSSLDSALNSLSAATVRDFVERFHSPPPERAMLLNKFVTIVWGAVVTALAFFFAYVEFSDTVVEGVNKIGSLFYGPILAAFLAGLCSRRTTSRGVLAGLICGVATNLCLWLLWEKLHWMWWNVFGLGVALTVAAAVSRLDAPPPREVEKYALRGEEILQNARRWRVSYLLLLAYFCLILATLWFCTAWAAEH